MNDLYSELHLNRGSYKHPEVEEVVSKLLNRRNTTALVDLTNEVENETANVNTPSTKTSAAVNLSHSESSSDIEKDATDCNITVPAETGTSNLVDKVSIVELTSANETFSVKRKDIPDIPHRCKNTTEVANDAMSENVPDKLDNTIQTANLVAKTNNEKPVKEIGELLSSDDCSTSNTTDELLEELGINEHVTQSPIPLPVNGITSDDIGELRNKIADTPVLAVTGNAAVQVKTDHLDEVESNTTTCKKAELANADPTPTSQDGATASMS